MKRYALRNFLRHSLWVLIFLFLFCASLNLSLAAGIGSVLSLDGDGDEVRVEHAQSLVMPLTLTIETWIHPLGPGSGQGDTRTNGGIIVNKEGEYELGRFEDGSIRFAVSNEDPGWDWVNTGFVVPEGTWAHLAFTYSEETQTFQLFANGIRVFSGPGTGEIGDAYDEDNYFKIGGRRPSARNFFDGLIDEVRLWSFVRTEAEIQATMNTVLQGNESGLAGYWNFDDGTANDLSRHGNHGVLIGDAKIVEDNLARIFFPATDSVNVGDRFTLGLVVEDITNLAGWELDITFDPAVLQAVSVSEGDFLSQNNGQTFFQAGAINNTAGEIPGSALARISAGGISGTGTLLSITFEAKTIGEGNLRLHEVKLGDPSGGRIPFRTVVNSITVGNSRDVNGDGQINIFDLIVVAQNFGQSNPQADINSDGVVNIFDLIQVAQRLGESAAGVAPGVGIRLSGINSETIQNWIDMAHAVDDDSLLFQEGILNLKHILEAIRPDQTALLPNYPNPFNPETWIPYQLAHAAEVTLSIYDTEGMLVR